MEEITKDELEKFFIAFRRIKSQVHMVFQSNSTKDILRSLERTF
jgi:hypothetical protein